MLSLRAETGRSEQPIHPAALQAIGTTVTVTTPPAIVTGPRRMCEPTRTAARRPAGVSDPRRRFLASWLAGVIAVTAAALVAGCGSSAPASSPGTSALGLAAAGSGPGFLAAGSPSRLPGNILVADRNNNRLIVISPRGQLVWSKPIAGPSDAYLTPTGRSIIVTQHGGFDVVRLGVVSGTVSYRYGHSGHPGAADDHLHDPQTAQQLPDGRLVIADKSNCRIIFVTPPSHRPAAVLGRPGTCVHDPPRSFSYPDAAFPTARGGLVVTELTPAWVDLLSTTGSLIAALRVNGLSAPYDANEFGRDRIVATSHSSPGAVEEFSTSGRVLWRYGPASGPGMLDSPSLARVLPGGDLLVCDSGNQRIVVIDPRRDTIVWQYGHTGRAGSAPGFVHTPDSAVLVP